MNKLIVIVGPTSSNKSNLALNIANIFNLPIINADAFQVYKELNCGTNKLSKEIIKSTPIHLMDSHSIHDEWNIVVFQKEANKLIKSYHQKGITPIIVGGSNLYIDCLINGYNLSTNSKRSDKYSDLSNEELFNKLSLIDPTEARKITIGNKKRLIRALQIFDESNQLKTIKDINNKQIFNCLLINCQIDRQKLYDKINNRVMEMIKSGWENEVLNLIKNNQNIIELNAFKAIGYRQIYNSIVNKEEINIEEIAQKSRQYAKRQITWCKNKYTNAIIFDQKNKEKILLKTKAFLND